MSPLPPALMVPLLIVVAVAGACDILWRRIPNWASFSGLLAGFGLNIFFRHWAGLEAAGLGFLFAFGVYFGLYLLRGMGAGDVKLMAAVGAFAGPANWVAILALTAVIGAVCAMALVLSRGALRQTFLNLRHILGELIRFRAPHLSRKEIDVRNPDALRLPHGAIIALAVMAFASLSSKL